MQGDVGGVGARRLVPGEHVLVRERAECLQRLPAQMQVRVHHQVRHGTQPPRKDERARKRPLLGVPQVQCHEVRHLAGCGRMAGGGTQARVVGFGV